MKPPIFLQFLEDCICDIPHNCVLLSDISFLGTTVKIMQKGADRVLKNGNYYAHIYNEGMDDEISLTFYLSEDCDYVFVSKQLFVFYLNYIQNHRDAFGIQVH